jgi:O-antigen/teichoic acid export membrane protein
LNKILAEKFLQESSISEKIVRNTVFNIVGRFWSIIVMLFLTPYIISHVGVERYGIWAIISVITGYLGLFDFGIGASFIKYIAEYYTKKDYEKINLIVNTGFVFYSVFAIFMGASVYFFSYSFLKVFNIPSEFRSEALFVLFLGILIFGASNAMSPFVSIRAGLQRYDISNKLNIILSFPNIIGVVLFLKLGYGLRGLIVNNAIIFIINCIASFMIAFKILPQLRWNPFSFRKSIFHQLLRFGIKLQASNIASMISFHFDKVLISHFISIASVTFYDLGSKVTSYVRIIPLILQTAIVPAASEIEAGRDRNLLWKLYIRGSKYLILIGTPIIVFVAGNAALAMLAWMGPGYDKSAMVIQVLAIGYFMNFITGMGSAIALGMGRPEIEMKYGVFIALSNILLSTLLILKFGLIGAALGTTISLSVGSIYFFWMFHNTLNRPLSDYFSLLKKPIIACVIPILSNCFTNHFLSPFFKSRAICLFVLSLNSVIFAVIYLLSIVYAIGVFDRFDRNMIKNQFLGIQRAMNLKKLKWFLRLFYG